MNAFGHESVAPLPPPRGAFEDVWSRAGRRRRQRARVVTASALALVVCGGTVLGLAGLDSVNRSDAPPADREVRRIHASVDPSPPGTGGPDSKHTRSRNAGSGPTGGLVGGGGGGGHGRTGKGKMSPPPEAGVFTVRLIDAATGLGAAGLYAWPSTTVGTFTAAPAAFGRTDSGGRVQLPCTTAPVLFTPWPLIGSIDVTQLAGSAPAPKLVSDPMALARVCAGADVTVRVDRGITMSGAVGASCPAPLSSTIEVATSGPVPITLTLSGLSAGGCYLVPGLPAGVVRVTDAAGTTDVDVSTDPTSHDVTLPCADMTSPPETTSPDAAAT